MKILEAIQSNPIFSELDVDSINYVLLSRSIDGSAEFTQGDADDIKNVELASADLYLNMALIPSFSEGTLSITYDSKMLKSRARAIYSKYDDPKLAETGLRTISLSVTPKNIYGGND